MIINTPFIPGANNASNASNKPKADVWLNVGYTVEVDVLENGVTSKESRFVSLPFGIAFDTMELLNTNSQNVGFSAFQAARNDLHGQIMQVAKTMAPGEEKIIGGIAGGLQIQLRRVAAPIGAPVASSNPFMKALAM